MWSLATVSVGVATLEPIAVSIILPFVPLGFSVSLSRLLGDHVCLNQTCSNGPCRSINDPPYFECPPESSECDPDCKSGEQCVVSVALVIWRSQLLLLSSFLAMLISQSVMCCVDCLPIHYRRASSHQMHASPPLSLSSNAHLSTFLSLSLYQLVCSCWVQAPSFPIFPKSKLQWLICLKYMKQMYILPTEWKLCVCGGV